MWSVVVEVGPPRSDQLAGMTQAVEQMLIQTFISHAPVEAFDEPVLHRFAWCDVVPINLAVFLPLQDRIRSEFSAVIADHHAGLAAHLGNAVQLTTHTVA